jgi:hypothetical protein
MGRPQPEQLPSIGTKEFDGVSGSEDHKRNVKDLVKSIVPGRKRPKKVPDLEEGISGMSQEGLESNGIRGFFDQVAQIRQKLLIMRKNVDNISLLHSKALTAISEKEEQRTREQLDQSMTEVSLLAAEIRNALKG